jgi:hypothetical protein
VRPAVACRLLNKTERFDIKQFKKSNCRKMGSGYLGDGEVPTAVNNKNNMDAEN